ncbi:hypothetical protein HGRIS_004601 [Hohenbuehelia grisea]|uniref:Uncharacterized protein n=1 Tax=Hohenbuehelia grisea TaxID=104357 RepID=A0ABR3JCJ4_9AGAR
MQIFVTKALVLLVVIASARANVVCIIKGFSDDTDKAGLHSCLDGYRTDNWNGIDCGGEGWFKGTHNYKSPQNCYDACYRCISQSIDAGASDVESTTATVHAVPVVGAVAVEAVVEGSLVGVIRERVDGAHDVGEGAGGRSEDGPNGARQKKKLRIESTNAYASTDKTGSTESHLRTVTM